MYNKLKYHTSNMVDVSFEELFEHLVQEEEPKFLYYSNPSSGNEISFTYQPISDDAKNMMTYENAFEHFKSLITTLFTDTCMLSDTDTDENQNHLVLDHYANIIARRTRRGRGTVIVEDRTLLYVGQNPGDNAVLVIKKGNQYRVMVSPDVPDRTFPAHHYGVMLKYS